MAVSRTPTRHGLGRRSWSLVALTVLLVSGVAVGASSASIYTETRLTPSESSPSAQFGSSVAMDDGTTVIGAPYDDSTGMLTGAAYVFPPAGSGAPTQTELLPAGGGILDDFGRSVAVDDGTVVVGAPSADIEGGTSTGAAYVFTPTGSGSYTQTRLLADDGADGDLFGWSVAIDDGTILVGASHDDNEGGGNAGSVYVFSPDGSGDYTQTRLLPSDGSAWDVFGYSVAADDGTVVVGALGDDNVNGTTAGAAYVFSRTGSGTQTKLLASDGTNDEQFGYSVAADNGTIVVGTNRPDTGAAYVFAPSGSGGYTQTTLLPGDGNSDAPFGRPVAADGGTVVVGAQVDENSTGAAHVFIPIGNGTYAQSRLREGAPGDGFGYAAAIDSGRIVVGAPREATDSGNDAGAAYTFVDTSPPETTITAGPSGTDARTDTSFRFSSDEPGAEFQCRLDAGNWSSCSSPRELTALAQGAHTFRVRAIDVVGNVDPTPATRTWTVDSPDRLAGADRYATAVAIGLHQFPDGADTADLARADNVVDAVAGGVLTDGPVLLVDSCGPLPAVVTDALTTLAPSHVTALGGPVAICNDTLAQAGVHTGAAIDRLAGPDRYATAVAIGLHQFPDGADTAYLARADNVVDAVAGGVLTDGPVLLVDSCGPLPAVVTDALTTLAPSHVTALGGPVAICNDTLAQAGVHTGAAIDRLAGPDRYATAVAIGLHQFPDGADTAYLARADNVVDAVAGGVLTDGPVLLVDSCGPLPAVVTDALTTLAPSHVTALGGPVAICNDTLAQAQAS